MSSACEGEEVFYDSVDQFMCERDSDYDVWLSEPLSFRERREIFLSRMGFVETTSECRGDVSTSIDDDLLCERRKSNSEANCSGDYSDQGWLDDMSMDVEGKMNEAFESSKQCEVKEIQSPSFDKKKKKMMSLWRQLTNKMKKNRGANVLSKESTLRIEQSRKRYMECSAVYAGQQIKAHNGLIWTMKFSTDGKYLATGGADGLVCIWRVTSVDKCSLDYMEVKQQRKKRIQASVVIPEKIFHIEEEPLQRFQGHSSDVLDLAWSTSNHLLSSSMDETVCLWQVGSTECLGVFHHSNYVTCVQFNPVDENYFISGSIDGKVRIWGIHGRRVNDWANVRDIVTAVCYLPDGKGFVVGSVSGNCRFYEISGNELLLNAEVYMQGKRKSSGNKITGIQFLKNDSQRVMITSEDSKIRILDGLEVVCKYKGLTKSGCQMSASLTSSGTHIVSVGEDSRVYLWNYDDLSTIHTSRQAKSSRSCENFLCEGVSVAIPWSDLDVGNKTCLISHDHQAGAERFSLANWFSMDGSSSRTWPQEKLPLWDAENECCKEDSHVYSTTWGLVFVTANWDGTIRTFHNYGLPLKI